MKVYDPLYGMLRIPEDFAAVIESAQFRRLQHVRQLGLCYLSFPGGNHSRFEHSIGAYHLASSLRRVVLRSGIVTEEDANRLGRLLELGALCHDVGHGPFSHMVENVLMGLGAKISHEDMGAAILFFDMQEVLAPFAKWGIKPDDISRVLLHQSGEDMHLRCAEDIISSELDVDRIDYLHRDLHYTGIAATNGANVLLQVEDAWELSQFGNNLRFELTESGVRFAEEILFLRRNNYQRIVYESRHMSATGMFEKAVAMAAQDGGPLNELVYELISIPKLELDEAYRPPYEAAKKLYSLVDFEALALLQKGTRRLRTLTHQIRLGHFYESVCRIRWDNLHYVTKQVLSGCKSERDAYHLRRSVEVKLAEQAGVEDHLIVAHILRFPSTRFASIGVQGGQSLEDVSEITRFLKEDIIRQYAIEIFVSPEVERAGRDKVTKASQKLFQEGLLCQ